MKTTIKPLNNIIENEDFMRMKKRVAALKELSELTKQMTDVMYTLDMKEMYFNDEGKTKFVFDHITIEN